MASYAGGTQGVSVVNLNPAPVPGNMGEVDSSNIFNYIVENDPLYNAINGAGLGDRVIGQKMMLPPGLYGGRILNNHIGDYGSKKDADGNTIITYSTASFIPFSIFHKDAVISGSNYGAKININPENMSLLKSALDRQKSISDAVIKGEFDSAKEELTAYQASVQKREEDVKKQVNEFLITTFSVVSSATESIQINYQSQKRTIMANLRSPDKKLDVILRLASVPVKASFDQLEKTINSLVDFSFNTISAALTKEVCQALFINQNTENSIPNKILKQHKKIGKNITLVNKRWMYVSTGVKNIETVFTKIDDEIAKGIASNNCDTGAISIPSVEWPDGKIVELSADFSKKLVDNVQAASKDIVTFALNGLLTNLFEVITIPIGILLKAIDVILEAIELIFLGVSKSLSGGLKALAAIDIFDLTDDIFEDAANRIDNAYSSYRAFSNDIQENIRSVNTGLSNIDGVVKNLSPYLTEKIMSTSTVNSINQKYSLTQQSLDRSKVSFGEIAFQLQDHKAKAIDLLGDKSKIIKTNFEDISSSISGLLS
ncbi:hypothetical protein ACOJIU_04020 [Carnobacterium maltaromaticum]|uniref:hypothetical protein n=1 Tax=Carnobacterium maltaromaticum TaxID=2751 RepID=UPI003B98534E